MISPFPASEMHDPQFGFTYVLLQFPHNHTGNFNSHLKRAKHKHVTLDTGCSSNSPLSKCHDQISDHQQAVFLTTHGKISDSNSIGSKASPFMVSCLPASFSTSYPKVTPEVVRQLLPSAFKLSSFQLWIKHSTGA